MPILSEPIADKTISCVIFLDFLVNSFRSGYVSAACAPSSDYRICRVSCQHRP
jgi:hypothetical protein